MTNKNTYTTDELADELGQAPDAFKKRLRRIGIKPSTVKRIGNLTKFIWSEEDVLRVSRWLAQHPAPPRGRPQKKRSKKC